MLYSAESTPLASAVSRANGASSYPAHRQVQLELRQSSAHAHSLADAKGHVGKGVDGVVLSKPPLRFEALSLFKVFLVGPQGVAVDHQDRLYAERGKNTGNNTLVYSSFS